MIYGADGDDKEMIVMLMVLIRRVIVMLILMVMMRGMIVMHRKVSPISRRLVTLCTSQVVSTWMMRMNMMTIFCANNH